MKWLAVALVSGAALLQGAVFPPASMRSDARCSISRQHLPRHQGEIPVLARATADTVAFPLRRDPGWTARQSAYFDGVEELYGQVFDVERAWEGSELRPGDRLVVVPWAYDASCFRTPWEESARWVGVGELGFFLLQDIERVDDGWFRSNVLGWHDPYPQGAFLGFRSGGPPRSDWMSAEDLFELSSFLPSVPGESGAFLRALREWARDNPEAAGRDPVSSILSRGFAR